jgi:hypothetical protein
MKKSGIIYLSLIFIAGKAETEKVSSRLMASMKEWQKTLGDGQKLRTDNPKPKEVDYSSFKQRRDRWQPDWIYKKYFR